MQYLTTTIRNAIMRVFAITLVAELLFYSCASKLCLLLELDNFDISKRMLLPIFQTLIGYELMMF